MTYVDIGIKLIFGLVALLVVTRLLGKKEMSQLTPFDFIYSIVLGGILEESIYDDKVSGLHVWFAAAVWGIMLYGIEKASKKYDKIRIWLKGEPSILIQNGEFMVDELNKNHLEMEQLRTMLREHGVFSLREVRDLYLEPGGSISMRKYAEKGSLTPEMIGISPKDDSLTFLFIDEGEINESILEYAGKTKEWLCHELEKERIGDIKEILYAEWSETDGFFIKTYNGDKNGPEKGN